MRALYAGNTDKKSKSTNLNMYDDGHGATKVLTRVRIPVRKNALNRLVSIQYSLPQIFLDEVNFAYINITGLLVSFHSQINNRLRYKLGQIMTREKAKPTIQIDNKRVKVTRWNFAPGAETGWHIHEMDYIVVPLMEGILNAELPDGSTVENKLTIGASYSRPAGVNHNIINMNNVPYSFIEIELK